MTPIGPDLATVIPTTTDDAIAIRAGRMRDDRGPFARYRVRLGFVAAALALYFARPTWRSLMAGAVIAMAGEGIRIWAAGHLEKGREVTSSGPYRFTRHPLYLGSAIMGVGLAVASASPVVALILALYLGVTFTSTIRSEERHLTEKFGGAYPAYRSGELRAVRRRFSAARVLANREHRAVAGLVAVLALLGWKAL